MRKLLLSTLSPFLTLSSPQPKPTDIKWKPDPGSGILCTSLASPTGGNPADLGRTTTGRSYIYLSPDFPLPKPAAGSGQQLKTPAQAPP
uniref:Uncharacterized protein n=1 Tax=Knipowitschia caucasica TaxID=637954 RepID=A0AAV2JLB6_KNICA